MRVRGAPGEVGPTGFVKHYDPDAADGRGELELTTDVGEAKEFKTLQALYELWTATSAKKPIREDGQPNRPLTAMNIEVLHKEWALTEELLIS